MHVGAIMYVVWMKKGDKETTNGVLYDTGGGALAAEEGKG